MHPQDSLAMANLINIKMHNRSGLDWKQDKWSPGEDRWNNSGWMMVKLNNDSNTTPFHFLLNDLQPSTHDIRLNLLVLTFFPITHSTVDTKRKQCSFSSSEIEPAVRFFSPVLLAPIFTRTHAFSVSTCFLGWKMLFTWWGKHCECLEWGTWSSTGRDRVPTDRNLTALSIWVIKPAPQDSSEQSIGYYVGQRETIEKSHVTESVPMRTPVHTRF